MSRTKFGISNRGTSLIEILVVMLVLLVGIMTVIRVFPIGFGVVKAAESQTIATRLAQRELEKWKNMSANVPDGIVPIELVPSATQPPLMDDVILNDQYPGPPFESWVKSGSGYKRGNLLNLRKVIGETTSIPIGSFFSSGSGNGYGSQYTLAFSPVDVDLVTSKGQLVADGLQIKGGDLRRRIANSDNDPPYLRRGEYAVDYCDGEQWIKVAFPRENREMMYYITYSYWEEVSGQPVLKTVSNTTNLVPADYDGNWITIPIISSNFVEVESETDSCARGFKVVYDFTNDPYEYKLVDPILGVVAFNPIGHEAYEYTAQGVRPLLARMDYRIYDSRIIRDDRVLSDPEAGKIKVKLSLSHILDAGDPAVLDDGTATDNPNEETFEGLMPSRSVTLSMLAIDLATGLRVDETALDIDYDTGTVTLPETADLIGYDPAYMFAAVPLAGRHIRFFYRADGDWTVSCQKAYTRYIREYDTATVDYCHFKLVVPVGGTIQNRLFFAQCESGKTVSVDYTYVDSAGLEHRVIGESHRISDDAVGVNCYADLTPPVGAKDSYSIKDVVVVGTSFKVRVVWRDVRNWRHVDMETNLMRDRNKL